MRSFVAHAAQRGATDTRQWGRPVCEGAATLGPATADQGYPRAAAPGPLGPRRVRSGPGSATPEKAAGPGGAAQDGGGRPAPPRLCTALRRPATATPSGASAPPRPCATPRVTSRLGPVRGLGRAREPPVKAGGELPAPGTGEGPVFTGALGVWLGREL